VNQQVARGMLEQLGYQADVAGNGIEAIEALTRNQYLAVLMDCQMPEMDGFAASTEIRRREGATQHTPIIAMTASAMQGDRERCIAAGMDDYVAKPVRVTELVSALRRWVRPIATPAQDGPEAESLRRSDAEAPSQVVPAAAAAAAGAVVDEVHLATLRRLQGPDQPDFIAQLIAAYFQEVPQLVAAIGGAIAEENARGLVQTAHRLKGDSGTLGMREVEAICGQLEQVGRGGTVAGAEWLMPTLDTALGRARVALTDVAEGVVG
jgi:CheY-like chemotaxis protein/HPt (histidine-containing phosphotransfer) domain-containing protein